MMFPDGWAPGSWRISGSSHDAGWLPVPPRSDQAGVWVEDNARALRDQWGTSWRIEHERLVPLALDAAMDHRRENDLLMFQLWPTDTLICFYVHVALGRVEPGQLPQQGDGVLYDAAGLGPGVLVPVTDDIDGQSVFGLDFWFSCGDVAVIVSLEPTLADFLGTVSASVHAFVQSIELVDPDGRVRRAEIPALAEAAPSNTWVGSLSES